MPNEKKKENPLVLPKAPDWVKEIESILEKSFEAKVRRDNKTNLEGKEIVLGDRFKRWFRSSMEEILNSGENLSASKISERTSKFVSEKPEAIKEMCDKLVDLPDFFRPINYGPVSGIFQDFRRYLHSGPNGNPTSAILSSIPRIIQAPFLFAKRLVDTQLKGIDRIEVDELQISDTYDYKKHMIDLKIQANDDILNNVIDGIELEKMSKMFYKNCSNAPEISAKYIFTKTQDEIIKGVQSQEANTGQNESRVITDKKLALPFHLKAFKPDAVRQQILSGITPPESITTSSQNATTLSRNGITPSSQNVTTP